MEREEHGIAAKQVGEARCRYAADQNGQQRRHRQVNHQHFQSEHQSCYWSLEDACYGSCGTTSHQRHQRLVVQLKQFTQIRTYR